MSTPIPIDTNLTFAKKYTFCTLVTRFDEYLEMVESAKNKGFIGDDVEFLYFDNQNGNGADGYLGINVALQKAQGEYLIFCHQDIVFFDDDRKKLDACLQELENQDKNWAVCGNAGKDWLGYLKVRITDPSMKDLSIGNFPEKVMSLDENFLILNRKNRFANSSAILNGFHLYALDLCQNAITIGLNCYVIDFHLKHKSSGNLNQSYFDLETQYKNIQFQRKQPQDFFAVCSHFTVGNSKIFNWIFKYKTFARWRRSYLKRFQKK